MLEFWIENNAVIIEWLVIAIIALVGGYFGYNYFFAKYNEPKTEKNQTSEIEAALKRVLEQADLKLKASSAGTSASSELGAGGDTSDIERLEFELSAKEQEIANLKASLESDGGNVGELKVKLAELEARLKEYEIIEDDIADLSKYRDENRKLKDRLAKLSKESFDDADDDDDIIGSIAQEPEIEEPTPTPDEDVPTPKPTPEVEEPEPKSEPEVEEPTLKPEPEVEEPEDEPRKRKFKFDPTEEHEESAGQDSFVTEDLINEFEQAVNQQKASEAPKEDDADRDEVAEAVNETISTAGANADAAETAAEPQQASAKGGGDIFAEFEAEDIDTDKMLDEIDNLEVGGAAESSLEEDIDVNKMASEAKGLKEEKSS